MRIDIMRLAQNIYFFVERPFVLIPRLPRYSRPVIDFGLKSSLGVQTTVCRHDLIWNFPFLY